MLEAGYGQPLFSHEEARKKEMPSNATILMGEGLEAAVTYQQILTACFLSATGKRSIDAGANSCSPIKPNPGDGPKPNPGGASYVGPVAQSRGST